MWKIAFATGLVLLDQLSKYLAKKGLLSFEGGFFDQFLCNQNIAWSIQLEPALFFTLWMFAASLLFVILKKSDWNIFLLMAFSGAISNAIDRFFTGCVADFISIGNFPVFNFADMLITAGLMLFLIKTLKNKPESGRANMI